jgi:RES domain-containing protein
VIAYRLAAFATPLRTVPASQPARYNLGNEAEPTQYLSLHPLGPLAELMRNHDLRTVPQVLAVRARTWALKVETDGLAEIGFDNAADFGIEAKELVDDNQLACRRLAGELRRRLPGIVVPSAALPGTRNVVLFGPRVAAPYLTRPVSTLDIPASITAEDGRPLVSLLDVVRFKGEAHAALEAWSTGASFSFREPDWSLADGHSD